MHRSRRASPVRLRRTSKTDPPARSTASAVIPDPLRRFREGGDHREGWKLQVRCGAPSARVTSARQGGGAMVVVGPSAAEQQVSNSMPQACPPEIVRYVAGASARLAGRGGSNPGARDCGRDGRPRSHLGRLRLCCTRVDLPVRHECDHTVLLQPVGDLSVGSGGAPNPRTESACGRHLAAGRPRHCKRITCGGSSNLIRTIRRRDLLRRRETC